MPLEFSKIKFITIFLLSFFYAFSCLANSENIVVKGNERIDEKTIISYLDNKELRENRDNFWSKSLKKLYESGLFLEAKIYHENKKIVIEVQENPIILDVKIIGNKKLEDEALQSEISLKKRAIFTKSKLQNDLKRLSDLYLKSGRFLTKIEPKIIQKEQNRVEIIFEIFEGPKAKIADIYFIGNENFSDPDLLSEISTSKSKWWKFLSSADSYDSDRIDFDKEKLRRFYGSNGYADFNAISAIAQIAPTKDKFFITFLLEEGIKYKFGEINIINNIEKFDESILEEKILVKKNKIFNSNLLEKTVDAMIEIMSEKSYAFAHIQPLLKRNKDKKTIDIDFVIDETPSVYVDQVIINGNTRTHDEVIRRELRMKEGDPYNINQINRSKQRLENLNFFEKVEIKTNRIGQTNKVDLIIEVKEKKTGELNLGIGYSTVDKITSSTGIKERNLFGTGQELGFSLQKSFTGLSGEINYTKPYFTGREIDVGFDLYQYRFNRRNTLVYDQNSVGLTVRANYSISEFLHHQVRYLLSDQQVNNVSDSASLAIRNLEGQFISSGIGHSLSYDKRDNKLNPKKGYYLTLSQELMGLGGDISTLKHEASAGYYLTTFSENYILKFLAKGGSIQGLGQEVRSNYGFFLGGNNFRGFEFAGMGPRVLNSNSFFGTDVLGGKTYYVGTAEFMFPLGLPKELGINGILFSDNGTVKGVDNISRGNSEIADSGSLRSSYGFSLAWASPMGPIRLDFSRILRKESYDRTQTFRFSFGTNF